MGRLCLLTGAIAAMLGVVAGTFGAHVLPKDLPAEQYAWFETGVRYHMYHALALVALGWAIDRVSPNLIRWVIGLFAGGIVFFSFTLYIMGATGLKVLGAIAPIGGLCFLAGWILVIYAALKHRET